ncbi:MAG: hypothetical protein LBV18_07525 [Alistipes sp.]|jgi:hypothetical protein|nr:hypothetical protein [Alistipes sp.]
MRKIIFSALLLTALSSMTFWAGDAHCQERYSYSVGRRAIRTQAATVGTYRMVRPLRIYWLPETGAVSGEAPARRYIVAVSPFKLVDNGLKFDFEVELPRPGHWFGTSITGYIASPRDSDWVWNDDYNNHSSGWDDYHSMWGVGTSAVFKNTFHRRGWYYSTGLLVDFFRVKWFESGYFPFEEDGLTFYEWGSGSKTRSYLKPSVQLRFGKHFALGHSAFFDLNAGLAFDYSIYRREAGDTDRWGNHDGRFGGFGGFAHRGFTFVAGFRLGFLIDGRGRSER